MRSPESNALSLFRHAAKRIPAYKDFLAQNKINPKKIKTIDDFKEIPPVDKNNYLRQYPIKDLCWDGNLFHNQIISVSSGSTGEPFFWPRGPEQTQEGARIHEYIYRNIFEVDKYSTLVVICFSMGTWIAGSFTTASTLGVADKGYKLNVITPGLDKEEAVKAIKGVAHLYEQVIITGYPPFVKDIIDEGRHEGIKWKKMRVRFLWAGEMFSEEWRDYMLTMVGSRDPFRDSVNIYGTADAAILGHETPVSIALRRVYNRKKKLSEEVFQTPILPSIVQYYPQTKYFEQVGGELVFTAASGIPLIRYNIHDTGGVVPYETLVEPIKKELSDEIQKHNIASKTWKLPFLYLNGRKDFTVTIYAVNIYPENIKAGLIDPKVRSWVTGKFSMATKQDAHMNQFFEINVELAKGIKADRDYKMLIHQALLRKLLRLNGEFNKLHTAIGKRAEPVVHLIPYGDTRYFNRGAVKHRWVKKEQ